LSANCGSAASGSGRYFPASLGRSRPAHSSSGTARR